MADMARGNYMIEKRLKATPERVWHAFADAETKKRWFGGEAILEHALDFRVGGHELTRRTTPVDSPLNGLPLTNASVYLDLVEHERIVFAYTMAVGEQRISASLMTVELVAEEGGTLLKLVEDGVYFLPFTDGAEMRCAGWTSIVAELEAVVSGATDAGVPA